MDTLKIQSVQDDVKYLDSIGRARAAEVVSKARIAETIARSDSIVRSAENEQREAEAQINAQIEVAKADAQKRLTDALTRRAAVVAEEQSQVISQVAQMTAELEVQKARLEQMRGKLDADVIQPAVAAAEAAENQARAATVAIIEDGKARAEALRTIAATWQQAGPNAREILLTQKLDAVIRAITDVIPETEVERVTMIDGRSVGGGKLALGAAGLMESMKQVFGIDLSEKLKGLVDGKAEETVQPLPPPAAPSTPMFDVKDNGGVQVPIRVNPRRQDQSAKE